MRNLAGREEPHGTGEGTLTQLDTTCRILFKEQSLLPFFSRFPKALSQKVLTIFRFEKPYLVHSWLCHVKFQDSVLHSCILPCVFRSSSFHNPWHPVIVSFLPRAKTLEHVLYEDHSLSNLLQEIGGTIYQAVVCRDFYLITCAEP